jgi:four helix bundle protein
MSRINSFEDINAWQEGREFNKSIYQIIENDRFIKDFDLKRQIRRSSISITSNIAEGFERDGNIEFR